MLSVDELKVFKPAPEVYQLAVDRLGVPKESIGFVSSNCWDALGAKSFGFARVLDQPPQARRSIASASSPTRIAAELAA